MMPVEGNMGTMTARLVEDYLRECVVTRRHAKSTQRTARYVLAEFARACPPDPKRIQRRHVIAWMDQDVECYVLDDGTRVLTQASRRTCDARGAKSRCLQCCKERPSTPS